MNLLSLLQQQFTRALTGYASDPAKLAQLVKPASDAKFGDYQANMAMALAKEHGKPPRAVAEELVRRLDLGDMLEKPEIAGPGFINLRFRTDWLGGQIAAIADEVRL